MAPAMRRMLEWLGLTDSVDDFDPDYHEQREPTYREPAYAERESEPVHVPRSTNVQVYADGTERKTNGSQSRFNPAGTRQPERNSEPRISEGDLRETRQMAVSEPSNRGAGEPLRGFNVSSSIKPIFAPTKPAVHILYPKRFRDATEVADLMRDGLPVILNLQNAERDLPRRMIDFCSGVTYALEGKMERVAESVFLLTPSNVTVSQEERANLSERGVF